VIRISALRPSSRSSSSSGKTLGMEPAARTVSLVSRSRFCPGLTSDSSSTFDAAHWASYIPMPSIASRWRASSAGSMRGRKSMATPPPVFFLAYVRRRRGDLIFNYRKVEF
jgi:hypothetical protein